MNSDYVLLDKLREMGLTTRQVLDLEAFHMVYSEGGGILQYFKSWGFTKEQLSEYLEDKDAKGYAEVLTWFE